MDQEVKSTEFSQQQNFVMNRSQKLNNLKCRVNVQGNKFMGAQKEIEDVRVILTDARKRLDVMKKRNA